MATIGQVGLTVADPLVTLLKVAPLVGPIGACVQLAMNYAKSRIEKDKLSKFIDSNAISINMMCNHYIMLELILLNGDPKNNKKDESDKDYESRKQKYNEIKKRYADNIYTLTKDISNNFKSLLVYISSAIVKNDDGKIAETRIMYENHNPGHLNSGGSKENATLGVKRNIIKKMGGGNTLENIGKSIGKSIVPLVTKMFHEAQTNYDGHKKTNDIDRGSILVNRSLTAINMGLVNLTFIIDTYYKGLLDDGFIDSIKDKHTERVNTVTGTLSISGGGGNRKTNGSEPPISASYNDASTTAIFKFIRGINKIPEVSNLLLKPITELEELVNNSMNQYTSIMQKKEQNGKAIEILGMNFNKEEQRKELETIATKELETIATKELKSRKPISGRLQIATTSLRNATSTLFKNNGGKRTVRLWPPRRGGKRSRQRVKSKKGVRRTKKIIS